MRAARHRRPGHHRRHRDRPPARHAGNRPVQRRARRLPRARVREPERRASRVIRWQAGKPDCQLESPVSHLILNFDPGPGAYAEPGFSHAPPQARDLRKGSSAITPAVFRTPGFRGGSPGPGAVCRARAAFTAEPSREASDERVLARPAAGPILAYLSCQAADRPPAAILAPARAVRPGCRLSKLPGPLQLRRGPGTRPGIRPVSGPGRERHAKCLRGGLPSPALPGSGSRGPPFSLSAVPASQPFLPAPVSRHSVRSSSLDHLADIITLHGVKDAFPGPKAPAFTGQTSWP